MLDGSIANENLMKPKLRRMKESERRVDTMLEQAVQIAEAYDRAI